MSGHAVEQSSKMTPGGGWLRPATVLRFLGAVVLAVAALWSGRYALTPDLLIGTTPADTVAFAHADRPAEWPTSVETGLPDGVWPDQLTVFWRRTEDGLERGVLAAWQNGRPTSNEVEALAAAGAIRVDRQIWIIATNAGRMAAMNARWGGVTVNATERSALRSLRRYFPIQGRIVPNRLLPTAEEWPPTVGTLSPFVIGATLRPEIRAIALTAEEAATATLWHRFWPAGADGTEEDGPNLPAAPLIMNVPDENLDLLALVLPGESPGGANREAKTAAADDLRGLLQKPFAGAVQPNRAEGTLSYVINYPTVPPDELSRAITGYFNAAYPESRTLELPDGKTIEEKYLNPDKHKADSWVGPFGQTAYRIGIPETGETYIIEKSGAEGSYLTNDAVLMSNAIDEKVGKSDSCQQYAHSRSLPYFALSEELTSKMPWPLISGLYGLTVVKTGDKSLIICGYYQ